MKELVIVKKVNKIEMAMATSNSIADMFNKEHKNVLRDIKNLECSLEFRELNFEPTKYITSQGKQHLEYLITKDGFTFLAFGFKGKEAAVFKEAYITQFNKMEELIQQKQTTEWKDDRKNSKEVNFSFTDAVQSFVEYAISQGSNNYKRYYKIYSDLLNKCLGIKSGNRDNLSIDLMHNQKFISRFLSTEIYKGIKDNTNYKQIYQNCKHKVEYFMECFGLKLKA